jgi:hypothetical protein
MKSLRNFSGVMRNFAMPLSQSWPARTKWAEIGGKLLVGVPAGCFLCIAAIIEIPKFKQQLFALKIYQPTSVLHC